MFDDQILNVFLDKEGYLNVWGINDKDEPMLDNTLHIEVYSYNQKNNTPLGKVVKKIPEIPKESSKEIFRDNETTIIKTAPQCTDKTCWVRATLKNDKTKSKIMGQVFPKYLKNSPLTKDDQPNLNLYHVKECSQNKNQTHF